jgi:translation initiation factor 2B subunit (eIF-2B alpha/beta/delta family)
MEIQIRNWVSGSVAMCVKLFQAFGRVDKQISQDRLAAFEQRLQREEERIIGKFFFPIRE